MAGIIDTTHLPIRFAAPCKRGKFSNRIAGHARRPYPTTMSTISEQAARRTFPAFSLSKLLRGTFDPAPGLRICIMIDLDDPSQMKDFAFLQNPAPTIQRNAVRYFHEPLHASVMKELGLEGGGIFAYKTTGGSNLDLPDEGFTPDGGTVSFSKDVYPSHDIILCISTYSATAPLTAFAKQYGFRGATLHGVNHAILRSGLAVDYDDVSTDAEKMRLGMTGADWVEIDFLHAGKTHTLHLELGRQEAQKSHGLCRGTEPDVANLPAGEIYFVPTGARGAFPMRYEDGTIGLMHVADGRIAKAELLDGDAAVVEAHNAKLISDPVTGELGELGFGTQILPVTGRDIQDEKIRGTIHVATGRSDHLGGSLTPDKFAEHLNATHDDILFAPHKTPEILVTSARMHRNGTTTVLIENYQPSGYINDLVAAA
jgi:aminopeptidase